MSFAEISENLGVTVSFDRVLRDEYEITVERISDDVVATLPGHQMRYANDRFDSVFLAVRSALYEKALSQRSDMAIFKLGHLSISSAFRPEQALTGIDLYAVTLALEESNVPECVKGTFQLAGGPLKPWVKFARLQQGLHQLRRLPLQAVQLPGYSEVPLPEVSPIDLFAGKIGSYVSAFPMQLQLGEGYSTRVEGNKTLVYQRKTVFDVFGLNYVDCSVPDFELVRVARRPPVLEEPISTREFFAQTNDEAVNFFTSHLRSAKGRSAFTDFESLSIYDFGSKDGEILWKMLPNRVRKDLFQTFKTVNAQHTDVGEIITILAEKILPEADQRTARLLVAARLLAQRGQLTYVGGCLQAR